MNMRTVYAALLLLLALGHLNPAGQLAPAIIGPEQASYVIDAGTPVTIHVMLENANDLYGVDLRASFNPALVEVIDADPAIDGVQVQPGVLPQPDFVVRQDVDQQSGAVRYVVTQLNPTPPASGSGILFSMTVRGRGQAGSGEFRIESVEIANRDGELLPVQPRAAALVVEGREAGDDVGGQATGVPLAPTVAPSQPVTATPASAGVSPTPPAVATLPPATTLAPSPTAESRPPPATAAGNELAATAAPVATVALSAGQSSSEEAAPSAVVDETSVSNEDSAQAATIASAGSAALDSTSADAPGQLAEAQPASEALSGEDPTGAPAVADAALAVIGEDTDTGRPSIQPDGTAQAGGSAGGNAWPLLLGAGAAVLVAALLVVVLRRQR